MPTLMVSVSGIRGLVGDGLDQTTIINHKERVQVLRLMVLLL